jgi:hypothetical protein
MKFNLTYDSSVNSAPAGFKPAVEAVAKYFEDHFLDPVTINLNIVFGPLANGILGQSQEPKNDYSYDAIRTALLLHATSVDDAAAALPANDPISGAHTYLLTRAQQKVLGLPLPPSNPDDGALDGTVAFQNAPNTFDYDRSDGISAGLVDFAGTVAHEFSEILGRQMLVGTDVGGFNILGYHFGGYTNCYTLLDLYHYSPGNPPAPPARDFAKTTGYFSIDDGNTHLNNFYVGAGGDPADWASSAGNDAYLNNRNAGVVNPVTLVDNRELGVLGWTFANTVFLNVASAAELTADIKSIDLASQYSGGTYDLAQDSGGSGTNFKITLAPGATLTEAADRSPSISRAMTR